MEIRYFKEYSHSLGRDMEFKVYGSSGKPFLFIPCQAGRFFDFENFKMLDCWSDWIEAGQATVYAVDTIDAETYANPWGDPRSRMELHERWIRHIMEEMVPMIRHLSGERCGYDQRIVTFGASLGAMHAANLFFRRPDLFDGVLALSGLYDPGDFFPGYMDDLLYNNSPSIYLANMPWDHPYLSVYPQRRIQIVVGQGAWEDVLLDSTRRLDRVLREKGIPAQVDYWGYDVSHDWDWWFRQVRHYVPRFL